MEVNEFFMDVISDVDSDAISEGTALLRRRSAYQPCSDSLEECIARCENLASLRPGLPLGRTAAHARLPETAAVPAAPFSEDQDQLRTVAVVG